MRRVIMANAGSVLFIAPGGDGLFTAGLVCLGGSGDLHGLCGCLVFGIFFLLLFTFVIFLALVVKLFLFLLTIIFVGTVAVLEGDIGVAIGNYSLLLLLGRSFVCDAILFLVLALFSFGTLLIEVLIVLIVDLLFLVLFVIYILFLLLGAAWEGDKLVLLIFVLSF
ncbi:hypothetical protein V8F20_007341 [Naviculisporaceae sp. PSN 640]